MQIVYIDVLFLINFCMDFLSLYISGAFLHLRKKQKRLIFSAFLGGVYAVASVIFEGNKLFGFFIGVSVSLLICYVAYGKEVGGIRFFRLWAVFYFVSFLLGGAISGFYNVLNSLFSSYDFLKNTEGQRRVYLFLLLAVFCSFLILLFKRIFSREVSEHSCKVMVEINGRKKKIDALIDSGNLLEDPISAKKVIIITLKSIKPIISNLLFTQLLKGIDGIKDLPTEEAMRIRLIPVRSIGSNKIILGYKPDKIEIEGLKKRQTHVYTVDAILGILSDEEENLSGYDAIIPESLLL